MYIIFYILFYYIVCIVSIICDQIIFCLLIAAKLSFKQITRLLLIAFLSNVYVSEHILWYSKFLNYFFHFHFKLCFLNLFKTFKCIQMHSLQIYTTKKNHRFTRPSNKCIRHLTYFIPNIIYFN